MKVNEVLVKVFEPGRLQMAWQQVRKNAGAAGIDQITVEEFSHREEQHLALIHDKLKSGSYRFQPAKRVLIPKEGTSRMRKLGIPVVMDRIEDLFQYTVHTHTHDPVHDNRYPQLPRPGCPFLRDQYPSGRLESVLP